MADPQHNTAGRSTYRPEIDGLRAIAVLAVMLYHTGYPWFRGGYLGVDVFFAVSGFLITGILVGNAEHAAMPLSRFYMRRIRRIIPALTVMCLVTLPFACWLMIPDDLENYGQSLFATSISANNVLLHLTSGYFQLAAQFKPLAHTWSLGAEEQYYVVVPLLLMAATARGGRRGAFALLALLGALSLLICELLRDQNPSANFLLLPSRFWELGLGGLTAIAQPKLLEWVAGRERLRQSLAALGLAAIIAGFWLLRDTEGLPGWQSLLPIVGTCAVLVMADGKGVGRILTARPMLGLGLISYSAYLYHVPVNAFVHLTSLEPPDPALLTALIPVSLLLAWLSWRFVEQPFRDSRRLSDRKVLAFCGLTTALTLASGLVLHLTSGFFALSDLARTDFQLRRGMTARYNEGPRVFQGRPFPTQDRSRNVLVIGNSFARDFINMAIETDAFRGYNLSYAPLQVCDPLPPAVVEQIGHAQAVIFGSGFTGGDARCLMDRLALLEARQVPHVIAIGLKQFGYSNNAVMLLPEGQRYTYRAKPLEQFVAYNNEARRIIPAKYYVDLFAMLDDGTHTVPVFTPDRKFISQDGKHLTAAGARYLGTMVFAQPQFAWLAKPRNQPS